MKRYLNSFFITSGIYSIAAFFLFFVFADIFVTPPAKEEVVTKISLNSVSIVEPQPISSPVTKTYKVHFRWGWGHLDSNGKQELLAILSSLDKSTVKEVVIEGRTDPTGSLAFNKRLAKKRASVVRKEFVDFGISPEFIVAKPQKPCCDGDLKASSSEMREKRRSDIEITIRQK